MKYDSNLYDIDKINVYFVTQISKVYDLSLFKVVDRDGETQIQMTGNWSRLFRYPKGNQVCKFAYSQLSEQIGLRFIFN